MSKSTDVSFFLLLVLCGQAQGSRLLLSDFNQSTSSDLISDGVHHHHRSRTFAPYLTLENALSALQADLRVPALHHHLDRQPLPDS
ncbi:unnamed protein product [Malus baccata var. baccata]